MSEETDIVAEWLEKTIVADAPWVTQAIADKRLGPSFAGIHERIYDTTVLQGELFPYIAFTFLTYETDLILNNARRVWASPIFELVVIGEDMRRDELSPMVTRLDQLFNAQPRPAELGEVSGGAVRACIRRYPSYRVQWRGDTVYRYLGGVYLARAQSN